MNYLLRCLQCGATQWVGGTMEDPETGAADIDDEDGTWWEGDDCNCRHAEHEIIDSELDDG